VQERKRTRIDVVARSELVRAIEADEIDNATEYAEAFARRHGLNPSTVRSSISRLRRELGLLKRRPRRPSGKGGREALGEIHSAQPPGIRVSGSALNPVTFLELPDASRPELARLAAAVLLRYDEDAEFRRAVDERRAEIQELYRRLKEVRQTVESLPPSERAQLVRLLGTMDA
jgi:hypothetical protein